MTKPILICIDRDGVLIHDEKYHLGSQKNWKDLIVILPKVKEGLKLLKSLSNNAIYIITNQPGVGIKEFPLLTKEKADEVCQYVVDLFNEDEILLDGYFLCPHPSPEYVEKRKDKYTFENKLICDSECIKPRPGMVKEALKKQKWNMETTSIYIIGDRVSDVEVAHNINATSIFIPFSKEDQEIEKVKNLNHGHIFIAKDFLDGVKFIIKNERNQN